MSVVKSSNAAAAIGFFILTAIRKEGTRRKAKERKVVNHSLVGRK
jgi:hypothetical protein